MYSTVPITASRSNQRSTPRPGRRTRATPKSRSVTRAPTPVPLHENVLGLDVEVEHPPGVGVGERFKDLGEHVADRRPARPGVGEGPELDALAQLHHQERAVLVAEQIVHGNDAWVVEPGHRDHFVVKEPRRTRVFEELGSHRLDGHIVPLLHVAAAPHLPHPPAAEQGTGAVALGEQGAGGDDHADGSYAPPARSICAMLRRRLR